MTLNDQTKVVNYYLIVVLKFPRSIIIINVKVGSSVSSLLNLPLLIISTTKARKTAYKQYPCIKTSHTQSEISTMIVPGLIRY